MTRNLVVALFFSLSPSICVASAESKVLSRFKPCGETSIYKLINDHTGKKLPDWSPPTKTAIDAISELFSALDQNNITKISMSMSAQKITGCRMSAPYNDLIFIHGRTSTFSVPFFWRVGAMKIPGKAETYKNPVDPLILEAPHQGTDNTTKPIANYILKTKARILIMNGEHENSSNTAAACQQGKMISDAAHSTKTLFFSAHAKLNSLYPFSLFVQLHGMVGTPNFQLFLNNDFNNVFTTKHKSGPRLFVNHITETFSATQIADISICSPSNVFSLKAKTCPSSNVEAHQTNFGNQCSKGKEDFGRFLHVEMGPQYLQDSVELSNIFAKTLNLAIADWTVE